MAIYLGVSAVADPSASMPLFAVALEALTVGVMFAAAAAVWRSVRRRVPAPRVERPAPAPPAAGRARPRAGQPASGGAAGRGR